MVEKYVTERLELRILKPEDAKLVLDFYIRNREFLQPWEPLRDESFFTLEQQKEMLEMEYSKIKAEESLRLWMFKKGEKKAIGNIGFSNIVRGVFQSCHLGYKLDGAATGNGYMNEALVKGIELAFNDLKLHRIEANIIPRNHASIHVVEKLGFHDEGLAKEYLKINDVWEDHIHYTLLNKNFK
ncbi:GNAT family N-acetyltransferase [Vallitalea okinawensis]|uniref:GNAT family N-acetyltransferase n=1 Tax=Vallitalea okinawensis TaxID=2078660 RepID=UPI000CFDEC3B|nr:GNAT family N-acetyltransferase [Vallitalea okinawensis]